MAGEPGSALEAAERSAQAVMSGNLGQLMMDLTPDALTQMMQMGTQATVMGAPSPLAPGAMPNISGYSIEAVEESADGSVFHVTFESSAGTATLSARWKQIMGQWKIAQVGLVEARLAANE
ncbi:MAG: hypothetical protein ACSLFM_03650 [Tepidiformaceae bacterium]